MSIPKERTTFHLTRVDRDIIKKRASEVGRSMSDYIAELVMWDNNLRVIEHAREGSIEVKELVAYASSER